MRICLSLMLGGVMWLASPLGAVTMAQSALDRLEKSVAQVEVPNQSSQASATSGIGYLGLVAKEQTGRTPGVVVTKIVPNGPAALAGIQVGDQIISVDGRRIRSLDDLDPLVRRPAGTRLTMEIRRGNTIAKGEVTLGVPPNQPAGSPAIDELPPPLPPVENRPSVTTSPAPAAPSAHASLGVNVVDVTPVTRKQYHLTVRRGAVIRTIHPGSAAARAGLPLGGAIVAVDGRLVKSADDLVAAIQPRRPGDIIEITYYDGDRIARKKVELGASRSVTAAVPQPAAPATQSSASAAPTPQATTPPAPPAPTRQPALNLGTSRRDRPLLRRLGQALDNLVPPAESNTAGQDVQGTQPSATPTPPTSKSAAASSSGDIADLQREIQTLQKQVQTLQQRLEQLEQKLNQVESQKKK